MSEGREALGAATQSGLGETVGAGLATGSSTAGNQSGNITKTLYIGNIFFDVTEDDLRREFAKHGNVTSVKVVYDARGLSKGYAPCGHRKLRH